MCRTLFPPPFGDEYKNHPSRHGSIALPVPEVPKMSVGAKCFTSSGSNGGCWVVLVFSRLFFFLEKWVFFPHARLTPKKKSLRDLHQKKKKIPLKKKRDLGLKKKVYATDAKKKVTRLTPKKKATYAYFHNRVTLSSVAGPGPCMRPPPPPAPPPPPLVLRDSGVGSATNKCL